MVLRHFLFHDPHYGSNRKWIFGSNLSSNIIGLGLSVISDSIPVIGKGFSEYKSFRPFWSGQLILFVPKELIWICSKLNFDMTNILPFAVETANRKFILDLTELLPLLLLESSQEVFGLLPTLSGVKFQTSWGNFLHYQNLFLKVTSSEARLPYMLSIYAVVKVQVPFFNLPLIEDAFLYREPSSGSTSCVRPFLPVWKSLVSLFPLI